ncbi:matrixin family metalloprotease [Spirillospora sp. NPDC048819]|uniref:matrixin family metalloprotease n=1 Tax=Spirillospora sp. NPDC048819 TaxID=3155268 RepID=UPI0034091494
MHEFSRMSRTAAVAAVTAALASTMTAAAGTALAAEHSPAWCKPGGILSARALPQRIKIADCDLRGRTVRGANGLAATVPTDGTSLVAHSLRTNGATDLRIEVDDRAGEVIITGRGERVPEARPRGSRAPVNPCADGAHRLQPSTWLRGTKVQWHYYPGTRGLPGTGINKGVSNMADARTDCGGGRFTPPPDIGEYYAGRTGNAPNITGRATCGTRDKSNTFGWLRMSGTANNVLAATCIWYVGKTTIETDMALQEQGTKWWSGGKCRPGSYSVEAVATHEAGHVFGLAHVPGAAHAGLTMAPSIGSCDNGPATLAKGDYAGLIALYGGR